MHATTTKPAHSNLQVALLKTWHRIRFGKLKAVVVAMDGGLPSEIEYVNSRGIVQGFWGYGSFDPAMPYQGIFGHRPD